MILLTGIGCNIIFWGVALTVHLQIKKNYKISSKNDKKRERLKALCEILIISVALMIPIIGFILSGLAIWSMKESYTQTIKSYMDDPNIIMEER